MKSSRRRGEASIWFLTKVQINGRDIRNVYLLVHSYDDHQKWTIERQWCLFHFKKALAFGCNYQLLHIESIPTAPSKQTKQEIQQITARYNHGFRNFIHIQFLRNTFTLVSSKESTGRLGNQTIQVKKPSRNKVAKHPNGYPVNGFLPEKASWNFFAPWSTNKQACRICPSRKVLFKQPTENMQRD